jgi:phosphatidate cytidylyltransferase
MSKFNTLGKRASTATVFVIIMIAGIFIHPVGLHILFGVILYIGLKEFFQLSLSGDSLGVATYSLLGPCLGLIPFLIYVVLKFNFIVFFQFIPGQYWIIGFALPVFIALITELLNHKMQNFARVSHLALAIVYLTLPIILVCDLGFQNGQFSPKIIMGLLCLIWTNDSGAYFVGSAFGKHKLLPAISPGKSWEGSMGGALITIVLAWFVFMPIFGNFSPKEWVVLSIIAIVFGTLGDLTESMLKRNHGVKDSGTFMPGHGGMLDRFDAFIFLIPFAYLYIQSLKMTQVP